MPLRVPRYHGLGQVIHADSCGPVKAALRSGELKVTALARGQYVGRRLPPGQLPEVLCAGFWDAPRPQSWGLDWHYNEGLEFTYLARGQLGFSMDEKSWQLQPGDLTITRPWQRHRVGNPHVGASRLYCLILDLGVRRPNQSWRWPKWLLSPEAELRKLTQILRHNERPVWNATPEVGRCFKRLGDIGATQGRPDLTRLKLHINELILALGEMLSRRQIPLDESLSSTRRAVELFLSGLPSQCAEPWTLEKMAERCGLGPTRFAWYCKQLSNLPPARYLARCRVENAARMLQANAKASITDVALANGFQSSQYFATVFRGLMGQTPRAFRQRSVEKS